MVNVSISRVAQNAVKQFYQSLAKKWKYSYSIQNMQANINDVYEKMRLIGSQYQGKRPITQDWINKGYLMVYYRKRGWYFGFKQTLDNEGNVTAVYVMEAIQNGRMVNTTQNRTKTDSSLQGTPQYRNPSPTARTDTEYTEWRKQMGGYVPDEMNDSIVSRIVLETINNYFKKNLLLVS